MYIFVQLDCFGASKEKKTTTGPFENLRIVQLLIVFPIVSPWRFVLLISLGKFFTLFIHKISSITVYLNLGFFLLRLFNGDRTHFCKSSLPFLRF